jgi:ubiquitin carboxyl-terminal hydrolase 14
MSNCRYTRKSKLSRAPGYLAVNMVRFHYKKKEQTAAKIKKDIKFSMELDIMPLCSKELVKKMTP